MAKEPLTGKSFFATLPGIITAAAGLITAVGGFLLALNKTGCTNSTKENVTVRPHSTTNSAGIANDTNSIEKKSNSTIGGGLTYSPVIVKHLTRYISYEIEKASAEPLPGGELIINLKMKCVNDSKYEYHFYSNYLRIKIGDDKYATDTYSPSGNYQSITENGFKMLEYNFKLPAGTKSFRLVFYDENDEIGSSDFVVL